MLESLESTTQFTTETNTSSTESGIFSEIVTDVENQDDDADSTQGLNPATDIHKSVELTDEELLEASQVGNVSAEEPQIVSDSSSLRETQSLPEYTESPTDQLQPSNSDAAATVSTEINRDPTHQSHALIPGKESDNHLYNSSACISAAHIESTHKVWVRLYKTF